MELAGPLEVSMVSHVHVGASVSATNPVQEAACIASTEGYTPPDIFFMPMDAYHNWIASLKEELEVARKNAEETNQ